jgi:hypothetical protein
LTAYDFGGGNDQAVVQVTFDFFTDSNDGLDDYPASLYFYFMSGTGSLWVFDVASQLNGRGWNDGITVGLGGAGWNNIIGSETLLSTTLGNVAEMGILLTYEGTLAAQNYGIDNFALHYPEPGTYAVLAFALLSLGVTFRSKLQTGLKGLLHK